MMIEIDKSVPMPAKRKYPFDRPQVGDSFFVPDMNIDSIQGSIRYASKCFSHRYCARSVDGGVRVWRVA